MNYVVEPGLYAIGNPGTDSEVFASANYRLSFDHLRKALAGMDAWILVLDTKGINVWCAAGKGTFGTVELIKQIGDARLDRVVAHRGIVVPQLGAPGIAAHEVKKQTGFRVIYGPVLARDISQFIEAGYKATPEMRRIRFGVSDRVILTPMELVPALKWFGLFALVWLAFSGYGTGGISFQKAWANGGIAVVAGLLGIFCGALATPVLLPWVPFRSFALKGMVVGLAAALALVALGWTVGTMTGSLLVLISVPALSSFLAFNFTGASTFTSRSGVAKEFRIAVPVYVAVGISIFLNLIALRILTWGE